MGPGRQHSRRPLHEARAPGRAESCALVRTSRISALGHSIMGVVGHRFAYSNGDYMADRKFDCGAHKMTLTKYYQRPLWRRALGHILPFCVALCIGALAIMTVDRRLPNAIVWGKIIPPAVLAGETIEFHYGEIKHTDYSGHVHRWIVDAKGIVYNLTDVPTIGEHIPTLGIEREVVRAFPVPCGISVGAAMYHSHVDMWAWWNLVQRIFPVTRDVTFPFSVKPGTYGDTCGLGTQGPRGQQGEQGQQGVQGPPGRAAPIIIK